MKKKESIQDRATKAFRKLSKDERESLILAQFITYFSIIPIEWFNGIPEIGMDRRSAAMVIDYRGFTYRIEYRIEEVAEL